MLKNEAEEQVDNILDAVTSQIVEGNRAQLLEEINRELEAFLSKENNDKDATDGVFDFLKDLS